jgi:hypothetical protein
MTLTQSPPLPATEPAPAPPSCECRVFERYPSGLPSRCQPASSFGRDDLKWNGSLENVSQGGVCLILNRRFEKGTGLAIELPGRQSKEPYTVLAKVVHVHRGEAGNWAHGCQFISELSEEEVARLRPLAGDSIADLAPAAPTTILLNLEIAPQTTIGCVIPNFLARNSWPRVAGGKSMLRGLDRAGKRWVLNVEIRECALTPDGWRVDCRLLESVSRDNMLRALAALVLKN